MSDQIVACHDDQLKVFSREPARQLGAQARTRHA